jgi:4-amino-4-deoxy-L-arabinose transferase-like glycosyltransferase
MIETTNGASSFKAAWRWWLPPALLALILALVFLDPFIGDWDALDYTVLALAGRPSSMLLGRMLFTLTNHGLWVIAHTFFHLQAENAYLLFKFAVVIQSPFVIIVWWMLARDLTRSVQAATVAVVLLAVSPFFILYSGQAMTEIPSLLWLGLALIIHLRGVRERRVWMILAGAALLGLSVNVREAGLLYAPWLLIAPLVAGGSKLRQRELLRRELLTTALACFVFLLFAFGPFALWYWLDIDGYRTAWHGWVESARMESARHPVSFASFGTLLRYFFYAAPLALPLFPLAAIREYKQNGLTLLLAFGCLGVLANLSLIMHYSVVINGRYQLTGLPAMLPLVAAQLVQVLTALTRNTRRALACALLLILVVTLWTGVQWWPGSIAYAKARATTKDYRAQLALVPTDAVVIPGAQTVAVTYWRGLGSGRWEVIGTGGGWPSGHLAETIEQYLKDGRRVFLDMDKRWWAACGWQVAETRETVELESRFRFRRVSDTIYEIRPMNDVSAHDAPDLQQLLPENRRGETMYCSG